MPANRIDQTAYARFAENKSEFIGISIPSSDILMFYPNPRTQIEFPLTYQNTFTDTYQRTADFGGGASNVENGTISTVVDGYGTIITPAGTYENVLRIKEISEGTLEVYVNGMLVNSSPFNGTSYSYVKAGYSTAILSISIFTFAGETTNSLVYSVSGGSVGIAEVNPFQEVKVFPSPAVDYVNVAYTLEKTTDVALKLIGLDGRLVANLGESQRPSGKNQFRLNLPEVAAGIYLLQISTPDGQTTERIAIQ